MQRPNAVGARAVDGKRFRLPGLAILQRQDNDSNLAVVHLEVAEGEFRAIGRPAETARQPVLLLVDGLGLPRVGGPTPDRIPGFLPMPAVDEVHVLAVLRPCAEPGT